MKKLLLLISIIPLLLTGVHVDVKAMEDNEVIDNCSDVEQVIVKIINNYNVFMGNGFIYKSDDNYSYIVTSSNVINDINNFSVEYSYDLKKALIIGEDNYNEVAVLRVDKFSDVKDVCVGNSNYLYKGQVNYLSGYYNKETSFFKKTFITNIGDLYYNKGNINVYKNTIQTAGNNSLNGVAVYDGFGRLSGMVSGYVSNLEGNSFVVESNKIVKIADSIVKTGNYKINYIKYSLEDYSSLSSNLKASYRVSDKANRGVVVVTFKPLNYIFGGLNQGMVIVAVNGVEVDSKYQLDKQLSRYEKKSKVCLKVIKKNGKTAYYYVKV